MKNMKKDIMFILHMVLVAVTGVLNVYGYFRLPDTIATQISFTGERVNSMPKALYLLLSFAILLILAVVNKRGRVEKKLTTTIAAVLVFIGNIFVIMTQLS